MAGANGLLNWDVNSASPPSFGPGQLAFNSGQYLDQVSGNYDNQRGANGMAAGWGFQNPADAQKFGGQVDTGNMTIGGTADSPVITIKNGKYAGMQYQYQKTPDGGFAPAGPGQQVQMGTAKYGQDVWMPIATIAGGYFGGGALGAAGEAGTAGAGVGAVEAGGGGIVGGAEGIGAGSGYGGAGIGGATGSGGGVLGAGSGLGAGGAVSGGSLLSNIKPTQAIQAGGLLANAIGGNKGTQGAPVSRSPIYADPNQQRQGPYQPAPPVAPPNYGSANRPASEIWKQYASGLFNPTYQPPSVPGVFGMAPGGYGGFLGPQMRPVGMPPGLLQQAPGQVPGQMPPNRESGY